MAAKKAARTAHSSVDKLSDKQVAILSDGSHPDHIKELGNLMMEDLRTDLPPRPVSPAVPQGPSNTSTNTTGPVEVTAPFNPMGEITLATGPNPDGLRHQGLVAAQGQPGMDHLTTESIQASRVPTPKEQ